MASHFDPAQVFASHPPVTPEVADNHAAARGAFIEFAQAIISNTEMCPEQTLALRALEQCSFYVHAVIARRQVGCSDTTSWDLRYDAHIPITETPAGTGG